MNKNKYTRLFIALLMIYSLSTLSNTGKNLNYPGGFASKTTAGVSFTENKGQVHDQNYNARPDVLFSGTDGSLVFYLKNNGISYQLSKVDSWKEVEDEYTKEKRKELDKGTIYRLDVNWLNSNVRAKVIKGNSTGGFNNYYLKSCPEGALEVRSFEDITYAKIYEGIDLKWYYKEGHLKYDYKVAAGADYKKIQLQLSGATDIKLNWKGELVISTPLGHIIEQAPLVIQNNKELRAKWKINNRIISFDIENVDPYQAFTIDPLVRSWGTYYGGNGNEVDPFCTTDASGNVYIAGRTTTSLWTVFATVGAHQTTYVAGQDAFLVKFNSAGVRQWGTYYGDTGNDHAVSCSTDAINNVYIAGFTTSATGTVIATAGSHQTILGGGQDAFLVKFNSSGVRQWGTYYGSILNDVAQSCKTDAAGNIYMAGYTTTNSGTIIATSGSHQSVFGGMQDAFLVKFNSAGVRQWGTYYGDTGSDIGQFCTTDAKGNVYLTGYTQSNTGTTIATGGAHQTINGGGDDAFLVKFDSTGIRQWGTYYGGTLSDFGYSCTTDAAENVYLTGFTNSNIGTIIATTGAHQTTYGGVYDAFLVKFNSAGIRRWGTYYGGIAKENGQSCTTDTNGNVYMAGHSQSTVSAIIATPGAHQTINGGGEDAFLVKFDSTGVRQMGTYYGGGSNDYGFSCTTDPAGSVYLTGYTITNSGTVIATAGSHQSIFGGATDTYLVKFMECSLPASPSGSALNICDNNTATLTATSGTATINWFATPSSTAALGTGTTYITSTLSVGTYTYYASAFTCAPSATRTPITFTVNANPTVTAVSNSTLLCVGQTASLTASGATSYTWNTAATTTVIVISPTVTTSYTVNGADANGCMKTAVVTQSVDACTGLNVLLNSISDLNIYPNPFNSKLTIVTSSTMEIQIIDVIGSLVYFGKVNEGKSEIDLTEKSNGIYFLKIGPLTKKIIKE